MALWESGFSVEKSKQRKNKNTILISKSNQGKQVLGFSLWESGFKFSLLEFGFRFSLLESGFKFSFPQTLNTKP